MPVKVMGQQYPVKLVPVVIPPYSLRLADYATSTDNKLQLQVLMTDLLEPQHQTGIKFSLEAGLNAVPIARSNDFVVGMNPFTLYPGNNITLTNVDLRSLFELQNLAGINAVQYSKPLADGVYQFCFQAYDYYTKNNLSSKTCTTVFMVQYDPPMLTLPQNAEKIQALAPYGGGGGVVFQWMPRQIAPNTRYIFTLKELWDQGQSPISGFLSAPPLWREETYAPTLYYGIDKTQLMPGKRYAWQVQAKSGNPVVGANSTDDNGVYKNNGLSEIFYFDYVENCAVPTLLMAKNIGKGRAEIRWSLAGQPGGLYNVQYRKKGSSAEWATQQSYQATAILTGLEDKTEYEYRVGTVCGSTQTFGDTNPTTSGNSAGNAYSYSGIQFFTTDGSSSNNNYQCGIMPSVDIANKSPLQSMLGNNEVFTAGDFPVTVLSAQGSNGIYTGTGFIEVPYLADTKIKVSFTNIKLNTDKKLIEGTVETTYDPTETAVHYASGGLGETFGDAGVKEVTVDYTIVDIKYTATPPPGKITVFGDSGNGGSPSQQDYPGGKDYEIKDKDGNIWTVDENGNVTKTGKVAEGGASNSTNTDGVSGSGSNAAVNQYTAKGIKIEWKEDAAGMFAYDTPEKTKLPTSKYPSVKDAENNTIYVPYKATVNKQTELFDAKVSISDPSLKDGKIIFKTLGTGKAIEATELNKTATERNYQLKLPGTFDYAEEEVIAVLMPKDSNSKQKVISSFRLVHLNPEDINVSLVPLDAASQSNLQAQSAKLNQIYNKIGVKFNVKQEPVLDISAIVSRDTIDSKDSELMSTYSPQQQQINSLYKGTDARYVLFVTDKKSSTGQSGYMRLNGQFGYVYGNSPAKTGAHELGHGVFKLEHPWKAYGTPEKGTNLLMDYTSGEELSHLEWKQVNDPAFKLYAFQGQSSGESISTEFNYIMPNNKPFKFDKADGKDSSDVILVASDNNGGYPNGMLYSFKLNGITYKYSNGEFNSEKGIYRNRYEDKNRDYYFRLVIQDTKNKCIYYLVNRKVQDLSNPILTPNNKPINVCADNQQIPMGGNGDDNGTGTETREETLQKVNELIASKLREKYPEKEVKFTILDEKSPDYQQKLEEAIKQTNYVVAIMDEEGKVKIKSSFTLPEWLSNALPDIGKAPDENCTNEYVNVGLEKLQNTALYKNALRSEQIVMEMGVIGYRGLFGTLYCMTDEKKFVNGSKTNQFIGGALHEVIATVDVAEIVNGVVSLVKSGAEQQIMAPVNYYNNLKSIAQKGSATPVEALKVILIPPLNAQVDGIQKGIEIGDQFIKHYFTECDKTQLKDGSVGNLCWYRYGQITVMVIPLVITGGEWAVTKVGKIAELAKVSQTLTTNIIKLETQLAAKGVILAEEGAYTILKNAETGAEITRVASKETAQVEKALQSLAIDVRQIEALLAKYPNLKNLVDQLGDLKQTFLQDFAKVDEAVIIELSKPNSELFSAWKNYRSKIKTGVICN
ncbi:uncharacterized protein CHSO_1998 [Chryseobacterium sp. StRB126]|nr:uncharacterized protein CHSO_1998 [Chryseobacterium sp. StRB126]